jgi:AraC family transcriptional regulator of adaptative response/methylated-DNA-[protein]-cysteine methyltransferase
VSTIRHAAAAIAEPCGFDDAAARWKAVAGRCAEAARAFVCGVRTTGVYCRPNCPSRLPRRENVEFFDTAADAEAAGYRPCKRCRPEQSELGNRRVDAVQRVCRRIETAEEAPRLEQLASEVGLSASRLHRLFKEVCGMTPKQYAAALRARRVQQALADGDSVTRAVYAAGFNASSRFYEKSRRILGMQPTAYAGGGAGEAIAYAATETTLGWLLVAATQVGVCRIELADRPEELEEELRNLFPKATLHKGDAGFCAWVDEIAARVETGGDFADLPLDIRGTAFMHRVWSALKEIPAGATRTYREIAEAIGKPKAARAVANACAKNPVAIAIPCHRVVRGDGSLGGYRGGVARKRKLLDRESKRRQS